MTQNGPAALDEDGPCVLAVRLAGAEQLLKRYESLYNDGEIRLQNECAELWKKARSATGRNWSGVISSPTLTQFLFRRAEDAEAVCEAVIGFADEDNQPKKPDLHKHFVFGIAAVPGGRETPADLAAAGGAVSEAVDLIASGSSGEIRVAVQVLARLPADRKSNYGPLERIHVKGDGTDLMAHRWRVSQQPGVSVTPNHCIMNVDMARSSWILPRLALNVGGDEQLAATQLQNQVKAFIAKGFQRAGVSYEQAVLKLEGDGGLFRVADPEQAHQVAEQILKEAEDWNARPRAKNVDDALRCFRIGIAYGPLARDAEGKYAGNVFVVAVRLQEGGCSGEIRICPATYARLPAASRSLYGGEEQIPAKSHDGDSKPGSLPGHRYPVTPHAPWEPTPRKPARPPPPPQMGGLAVAMEECFVISPIKKADPRIGEVFDALIVPACRAAGYEPSRADQIEGTNRKRVITDHLASAPLVIAYLGQPAPQWNADVMLEVGYRLALGMPMVMLSDEPSRKPDGSEPSFKELLPFHLTHETVTPVPADPGQVVDRLVLEINEAKHAGHAAWKHAHPITEVRMTHEEAVFTEVSPEAERLFGITVIRRNANVNQFIDALKSRMPGPQFDAFCDEQNELLDKINLTTGWRLPGKRGGPRVEIPIARIPLVLQETAAGRERHYLPIIVRYAKLNDVMRLRVLYLEVTAVSEKTDAGYWACDLAVQAQVNLQSAAAVS